MTLIITLLNTRSLKKHYKYIMKDQHLLDSDILCLTETQLQIDEDTSVIESRFQEHFKYTLIQMKTSIKVLLFVIQIVFLFWIMKIIIPFVS